MVIDLYDKIRLVLDLSYYGFILFVKSYILIITIYTTMLANILLLFVTIACVLGQVDTTERELIFVQEVFRHGARYPLGTNDKDGSNISTIDNAIGELTKQGKSQHYLLGRKMYETYWSQIFGNQTKYRQQKFYFKSTNLHRTIQSLQSHLQGLFQNLDPLQISKEELRFSQPVWNDTISRKEGFLYTRNPHFQPLPIHAENGASTPWTTGDILLSYWPPYCTKQQQWSRANQKESYISRIINNQSFIDAINAVSQIMQKNLTFFDVSEYSDNAIALQFMGRTPLPIFNLSTKIGRNINTIMVLQGYIRYFHNEKQLRAISTGIFNQTVNSFKRVSKNQDGVQWAIYSAHDTTIQSILARMGLTSVECIYQNYLNGTFRDNQNEYCIVQYPGYTSQIIFEVYKNSNIHNSFKVRYNGNYRRIPLCGWQFECDVQILYEWYEMWKDENWIKTCGTKNTTAQNYFSIMIVQLGVIIIFAVGAMLRYLQKSSSKNIDIEVKKHEIKEQIGAEAIKESLLSDNEII